MQELNFIKKYKKNSQPHYLYIRLPQVNDRNFLRPFSERVKHIFEIQLITDVSTLFFFYSSVDSRAVGTLPESQHWFTKNFPRVLKEDLLIHVVFHFLHPLIPRPEYSGFCFAIIAVAGSLRESSKRIVKY